MKNLTSRLPLPVTVLALSWAILGSILEDIIPFLSDICMIVSLILILLTILKLVINFKECFKILRTPVGLSMFSSFSMSLMLISVWMKTFLDKANIYVWMIGVILQTIIMVLFTIRYILSFKLKNVFATWFLVYSGMGIAAITCKEFGMIVLGKAVYNFTIYVSAILVPFMIARYIKYRTNQLSRPLWSLIAIPLSIILPAMFVISDSISRKSVWVMFVVIQVILLFVIVSMVLNLIYGFYSSWSSYAVSIAVSVYASMSFNEYLYRIKEGSYLINTVMCVEYVFTFIVCSVVLFGYFINTVEDPETHKRKLKEKSENERRRRRERFKNVDIPIIANIEGGEENSPINESRLIKNKELDKILSKNKTLKSTKKEGIKKQVSASKYESFKVDNEITKSLFENDDISTLID